MLHSNNMMKMGDSIGGPGVHFVPERHHENTSDTGDSWVDIVHFFQKKDHVFQCTKFIFPTAPTRPITLNGGMQMPGWANILGLNLEDAEDTEGYLQSVARIEKIIESERLHGISLKHIVLGGFSQGGAIAYLTMLSLKHSLAAVVALSSWVPSFILSSVTCGSINQCILKTPILACHGTADPLVSVKWGKMTVSAMESLGFHIKTKLFAGMGHTTCVEEFSAMKDFIKTKLLSDEKTDSSTNNETPRSA